MFCSQSSSTVHMKRCLFLGKWISQLAAKFHLKMLTASCLCCSDDSRKCSEILTTNEMFVNAFVPAAERVSTNISLEDKLTFHFNIIRTTQREWTYQSPDWTALRTAIQPSFLLTMLEGIYMGEFSKLLEVTPEVTTSWNHSYTSEIFWIKHLRGVLKAMSSIKD